MERVSSHAENLHIFTFFLDRQVLQQVMSTLFVSGRQNYEITLEHSHEFKWLSSSDGLDF